MSRRWAIARPLGSIVIAALTDPDTLGDTIVREVRNAGRTVRDLYAAIQDAGEDAVEELTETLRRLEAPLKEMLDGALEVGGGLVGMVIAQLLNAVGTFRPLTPDEKAAGRQVFGSTLDWD